jgi:hypothetical protein
MRRGTGGYGGLRSVSQGTNKMASSEVGSHLLGEERRLAHTCSRSKGNGLPEATAKRCFSERGQWPGVGPCWIRRPLMPKISAMTEDNLQ